MKVYCGQNIRRLREGAGLSQRELAQKMGIAHTTIASWEKNRTEPKMGAIEQMASIFGCEKTDIIPNISPALMEIRETEVERTKKQLFDIQQNIRYISLNETAFRKTVDEEYKNINDLSQATGIPVNRLEEIYNSDLPYVSWSEYKSLISKLHGNIRGFLSELADSKNYEFVLSTADPNYMFLSPIERSILERYRLSDDITKAMVLRALNIDAKPNSKG